MTEPISDERLAEIRAGLEGVTPGPWRVCETHEGEIIGRPSWPCRRHGVDGEWRVAIADELDGATFEQDANASHIARLDPQTVAALLSRLDKAEAGWQDISTAPKDGDDILATDARIDGGFPQVVYWDTDGHAGWNQTDARITYHPDFFTHWRRDCLTLPPPPSSES